MPQSLNVIFCLFCEWGDAARVTPFAVCFSLGLVVRVLESMARVSAECCLFFALVECCLASRLRHEIGGRINRTIAEGKLRFLLVEEGAVLLQPASLVLLTSKTGEDLC